MTITNEPQFIDAQFKDRSPVETVAHIKQLLASYGIEVEENWHNSSVPYCYALAGNVKGTTFFVNGKGLSKEFALASCYGELMERLQLGYIYSGNLQKNVTQTFDVNTTPPVHYRELLERNSSWYQLLSCRLKKYTGISMSAEEILKQNADPDGTVKVSPYFCLTTGSRVNYPNSLRGKLYTSNGCAAGNTPEETIVQAISEIVERHHLVHIIDGSVSLPDIPEEVLQRHTTAYNIISYIREQGYQVVVKDCSLGKKFPVVCVYIIDRKTGRYNTHFGAYPIFEIALERSLTESFQGRTIDNIARYEDFLFKKSGEFSFASISNEIIHGAHNKTTSFFIGEPEHQYNPNAGFLGKDNKALLQECIAFFKEMGYDILVRDRSCLGFCTYQVIIPGYSEVFLHRMCPNMNELRYAPQAQRALRNPSAASITDLLGMVLNKEEMSKFTSNIFSAHGFLAGSKLSAYPDPRQDSFLMSASLGYAYYALGQQAQALDCVSSMLACCDKADTGALLCLKRYLSLKANRYAPDAIRELLLYFHQSETVDALYRCINQNSNPFAPYTLHCDEIHCQQCPLVNRCCHKRSYELVLLVQAKDLELDFEKFVRDMTALI